MLILRVCVPAMLIHDTSFYKLFCHCLRSPFTGNLLKLVSCFCSIVL
uniref:Uncharacterized protein n=1 Tax=Aegilops tauschii subsp. strangulata TaxID=200361 RepID=A0A453B1A1_AEGTS